MKLNLKRIIKTVLITGIGAAILAYDYKERHELSWDSVLTIRFWILSILHLIPVYFAVWSFEDEDISYTESYIILVIIAVIWAIVLGIIWAICHFIFGFDLL